MKQIGTWKLGKNRIPKLPLGGDPGRRDLQSVRSAGGAPMTALYEDDGSFIGMWPNMLPTLDVVRNRGLNLIPSESSLYFNDKHRTEFNKQEQEALDFAIDALNTETDWLQDWLSKRGKKFFRNRGVAWDTEKSFNKVTDYLSTPLDKLVLGDIGSAQGMYVSRHEGKPTDAMLLQMWRDGQDFEIPDDFRSTVLHELYHRADERLLFSPFLGSQIAINDILKEHGRTPESSYYTKSEEIHARLMQSRRLLDLKPTEKFTKEHLEKLRKSEERFFKDIESVIDTDEGIIKLFNETVDVTKNNQTPIAKYGKLIKKLPLGGDPPFSTKTPVFSMNPERGMYRTDASITDQNLIDQINSLYFGTEDWLRGWYGNRNVAGLSSSVREQILGRVNAPISDAFFLDGNAGVTGAYHPVFNDLGIAPQDRFVNEVMIHELAHKSQFPSIEKEHAPYTDLEFWDEQYDKISSHLEYSDDPYEMLPQEFHARLMSARKAAGFNPRQKVTLKDIQKLRDSESPDTQDLFRMIKGDNKKEQNENLKKMFNEIVDISPKNTTPMAKYGKLIKKYPTGGTTRGRITALTPDPVDPRTPNQGGKVSGPRTGGGVYSTPEAVEFWGGMPMPSNAPTPRTPAQTTSGFDLSALMGVLPQLGQGFGNIFNMFQGSNPNTWMQGVQDMFPNFNPSMTPEQLTQQGLQSFGLNSADTQRAEDMANQFGGVFGLMEQLEQFRNRPQNTFNPNNWTVNPTRGMFQFGGDVESAGPEVLAIQTEKGELAALPDNTITKVKAKKKHAQMKADEVTDILPPESFVGSADKRMKFSKKNMQDISFGYGPISYLEGSTSAPPKEHTAADIMTKNKMTPAEYMKVIKNKFSTTGDTQDPFAMRADAENLESRTPYLAAVKYITEMKKPKSAKQEQEVPQAKLGYVVPPTDYYNNLNFSPFQTYGYGYGGNIPKADFGLSLAIAGGAALVNQLISGAAQRKANRIQRVGNTQTLTQFNTGMDRLENIFREGADRQRGFLTAGTALGVAGDLLQDTDYTVPQLDTRFVDAMPQQMPRTMMDQARRDMRMASRAGVNFAARNAPSFSRAANMIGMNQANQFNAISNLAAQQAGQNMQLRQNFLQQRGALANQQNMLDAQGENMRRQASNQRLASITNRGTAFTQGLGVTDANLTSNLANIQDRRTTTQMQHILNQNRTQQQDVYALASMLQIPTQAINTWGMYEMQKKLANLNPQASAVGGMGQQSPAWMQFQGMGPQPGSTFEWAPPTSSFNANQFGAAYNMFSPFMPGMPSFNNRPSFNNGMIQNDFFMPGFWPR